MSRGTVYDGKFASTNTHQVRSAIARRWIEGGGGPIAIQETTRGRGRRKVGASSESWRSAKKSAIPHPRLAEVASPSGELEYRSPRNSPCAGKRCTSSGRDVSTNTAGTRDSRVRGTNCSSRPRVKSLVSRELFARNTSTEDATATLRRKSRRQAFALDSRASSRRA